MFFTLLPKLSYLIINNEYKGMVFTILRRVFTIRECLTPRMVRVWPCRMRAPVDHVTRLTRLSQNRKSPVSATSTYFSSQRENSYPTVKTLPHSEGYSHGHGRNRGGQHSCDPEALRDHFPCCLRHGDQIFKNLPVSPSPDGSAGFASGESLPIPRSLHAEPNARPQRLLYSLFHPWPGKNLSLSYK